MSKVLHRRKFRSQTSDNMDRWKAEMGRVREKRRVEERRSEKRKSQKKEDADARKGRKVAKHGVFPMICGSGGSKSRLAKAAGAEPAGQMRDEKLHAVVARSTFPSQNVQNTPAPDHFWKLRCRKSARRCGAKHISKSKCTKHQGFGPLLEVAMSKKCTPLWREAHFQVKMYKTHQLRTTFGSWDVEKVHAVVARSTFQSQNHKTHHVRTTFGRSDLVSRGRRKGLCTLSKVSKTWGFCAISKNDGRRGTFERDLQRCIFRGSRSTRDIFIGAVRRWGRWFPETGCILEQQIFRFAEMILRDCGWPGITFSWQAQYFRQVDWKNCKTHWYEAVSSALNFPFLKEVSQNCFAFNVVKFKNWRSLAELLRFGCCPVQKMKKSRRIASFLMLSTSKNEEVSQNCFVFDVIKFTHWGSLGELLRFWCCQVQTMRNSRRIAPFLMLSSSKREDVSQNSFVFKLADRQIDR